MSFLLDHSLAVVVARDLPEVWYLFVKGII